MASREIETVRSFVIELNAVERACFCLERFRKVDRTRGQSCKEIKVSHASKSFSPPTKILVPVDFSDSSYAALAAASEFGRRFDAEIAVLHVISTTPDFNGSHFFPNTSRLEEARAALEAKLTSATEALQLAGIRASSTIEIANDTAETIIMVSIRDSIDMVIISTHGFSGWRPLIYGSVAGTVLKLSRCPLLLLPTAEGHSQQNVDGGNE
jgi:nucleotide-binding universal stress UspA family protein